MIHQKKVGLALGGGVARGMAHVGVLKVLEEAGIPVDFISGTSAGAVVAAGYAAIKDIDKLKEFALQIRWWRIARPVWPVRGLISFDKLSSWFKREFGELDFEHLQIPCVLLASDLETGVPIRLCHGQVARAVQASCSLPGLVTPVEIDGRLLVDGAMTDIMPVNVLREMGADYVIGVDVISITIRRWMGPFGYLFAGLEALLERSGGGIDEADCLISPDTKKKTYLRFSKQMEMYELGREAAIGKVDQIRQALMS
jgi:NTE family protein